MTKLPEFLLADMTSFYEFVVNFTKQNIQIFNPSECIDIYNTTVSIIRSKEVITNPYHGAQMI